MNLNRRHFLTFLGATAGTIALGSHQSTQSASGFNRQLDATTIATNSQAGLKFAPVKSAMPVPSGGIAVSEQASQYAQFAVQDDVVLPDGYTYDVVGAWGDVVGDAHFGYNNDYLSFVPTGRDRGYLTINFEYISGATWLQTYPLVMGKTLPVEAIQAGLGNAQNSVNAYALTDDDPLKAQIAELAKAALLDQGIGVIEIQRDASGQWVRVPGASDRRISGISGLEDGRYLQATGPAVAVFNSTTKLGYDDGLGDRIIGTFGNCSGGTTPWGTVLSAEENFQAQVPEPVLSDGSSLDPANTTFYFDGEDIGGQGNVFGLAGNKYGWMVEVDPADPNDYGTKHTWLGRFRHEAVAVRAVAGKSLAVYSGCDRRGGHVYKFVSSATVSDPTDKQNSQLLRDGILYTAKFNPDGTGEWLALRADAPINPVLPSQISGSTLILPNRISGGYDTLTTDASIAAYKRQYSTLGDLYLGNPEEQQGAILIDAHYAANAIGATPTGRPEDTDVAADGTLYIAFTSGTPGGDGGPDQRIFTGPNGEDPYEFGWIMKVVETDTDPGAMTFTWSMLALGGEPADGGLGFANPDNLEIDAKGDIWMVTDMSTSSHNQELPSRVDAAGNPVSQSSRRGLFGNNSVWYIPTSGANAGEAYLFAYGPMECEMTGPFLTADQTTLFLAAQHPGETHGMRQNMATETRKFAMKTTAGDDFMQDREVPIGSNWPGKDVNDAPRPAVIAVRRRDRQTLV